MKTYFVLLFFFFAVHCSGQSIIGSYQFSVTVNKTSNIIFPYAIKSVDRGSADILVQKANGAENILQVKAAREHFSLTTLSVITADGKLYPFLVNYDSMPAVFNLSFVRGLGRPYVMLSDETEDASTISYDADTILAMRSFLYRSVHSMRMELVLKSIYIKDSLLWFHFSISNHSLIPFSASYLHFFIRDRSRAKRTAMQQTELTPMHISNLVTLGGGRHEEFACAFHLFTIGRGKKLVMQVNEESSGRLLELDVKSKTLLKARIAK
ncbi:MAG TPA: conjugative transposon protein TraN [Puia sp.]|nr:conjugative transposon protein TraN [Puia sp.]